MNEEHLVDQAKWCPKCEHEKESEWDDSSACYDCMYDITNVDSTKPTGWKEKVLAKNS